MILKTFDAFARLSTLQINRLTNFLFDNQEQDTISKLSIRRAIEYAAKERPGFGGFIFTVEDNDELLGALVINKTGMEEYIPENVLVSMAVHEDYRDGDIEQRLLDYAIAYCKGEIGVRTTASDPLMKTFQNHGFKHNYLEMRLKQ